MEPISIMFVDDEEDMLDIYVQIFATPEFTCLRAKNVKEAVLMMESLRPDVIVTDMVMPNGSGDIIYELASDRGIPSILCSGRVDVNELELPALTHFLPKPARTEELRSKVIELAEKHRKAA